MAQYPFRHSTYYTRQEDLEFVSELPPMNSQEDVLQELQAYHPAYQRRGTVYNPLYPPPPPSFGPVLDPSPSPPPLSKFRERVTRIFGKLKNKFRDGLRKLQGGRRYRGGY
ncbi:hypothetical protein K435DRAFT_789979 [Dendrothele bispora CBS 962.96]|uniref:Uncharacterized protein n=1 Tax=Dendrothele bispora (strain CBS 962.96) TaxID=1314807 RepID=A0A4S8MSS6_DENBC|nr:hypothetical protein K435DRAFT_789979 [Dendrothele bispora CBS 962.96]